MSSSYTQALQIFESLYGCDTDLFYKGRAERTCQVLKEKFLFVSKHVRTSILWDEGTGPNVAKLI